MQSITEDEEMMEQQSILDGTARIPLSQTFPFVFEYVTERYEKQLGVSSLLDRNFLFLQQLVIRDRLSKCVGYQCLQPLIGDVNQKHLVIASLQRHDSISDLYGEKKEQKCFSLFYLYPEVKEVPLGLTELYTFFDTNIRPKLTSGANFSHILKALRQCIVDKQFHFSLEEEGSKNVWTFHYNDHHIFIFYIPNQDPQPHTEKQAICRWISVTDPIYERKIKSVQHVTLSDFEIQSIIDDPAAQLDEDTEMKG